MLKKTFKRSVSTSVAYPGCLYLIPDSDLLKSWIPDLTTRIKRGGGGELVVNPFLCIYKFNKIVKKIILKNLSEFLTSFPDP